MPLKKLHPAKSCAGRFYRHFPHNPHDDPQNGLQQRGRQGTSGPPQRSEGPASIEGIAEIPGPGGGGLRWTKEQH